MRSLPLIAFRALARRPAIVGPHEARSPETEQNEGTRDCGRAAAQSAAPQQAAPWSPRAHSRFGFLIYSNMNRSLFIWDDTEHFDFFCQYAEHTDNWRSYLVLGGADKEIDKEPY
jgi:hypothetical protein